MQALLIKNATIVNENGVRRGHVLCRGGIIERVSYEDDPAFAEKNAPVTIDAKSRLLIPGVIDDQVHFREPGLTHKADIASESRAAVAGGITSYMEMPNTSPPTTTRELLNQKTEIASRSSFANFSFYMGATNGNIEELKAADQSRVCGIKVFMGSSTGDLLVDDDAALRAIFENIRIPVAVHCEDEKTIRENSRDYRNRYGENLPVSLHPEIRSEEACWLSSSRAVELARAYGTRLHVLHISTARELELFASLTPEEKKRITSEVCIHHLWFDNSDYERLGNSIKWNPAIKTGADRDALVSAVESGLIDIVATDHAPHTAGEKAGTYFSAPSGGPMVQHALPAMLELVKRGSLTVEKVVERMCHAPARLFSLEKRGFIREGYFADLALVDMDARWTVTKDNILYKCGWSPMEGVNFSTRVTHTIVNGHVVYAEGVIDPQPRGIQLKFNR
ncbi:MAG: dihydroorotase [Marinilabiliales bacterium]|nr:MAG: dihydroorotase [Marinilabiliales bacterium]